MGFFSDLFSFIGDVVRDVPLRPVITVATGGELGPLDAISVLGEVFEDEPQSIGGWQGPLPEDDSGWSIGGWQGPPEVPAVLESVGDVFGELPKAGIEALPEFLPVFSQTVGDVEGEPPPPIDVAQVEEMSMESWGWDDPLWEGELYPVTTNGGDIVIPPLATPPYFPEVTPIGLPAILGPVLGGLGAGAVAAATDTLLGRLRAMFGGRSLPTVRGGSGSFNIGGVRGSLRQLWPAVRKYGPAAVAAALGVSSQVLAQMLMDAPRGARRRRRGISARDIATTTRVVKFVNKISRKIGCVRRPGSGYRRRRCK
jgi:hypothetical protein